MTKASTGMLKKGTQRRPLLQTSSPLGAVYEMSSIKSEIVSMEGFNEDQRQVCQ
jgi:hypothetical protein